MKNYFDLSFITQKRIKQFLFAGSLSVWLAFNPSPLWGQYQYLHSDKGSTWYLIPAETVGKEIYQSENWNRQEAVKAVVPGTVFTSYVNAGVEKDPNFGDNIYHVDRKKYDRSFWYRTEFTVPEDFNKELVWLNFNGVNRKADIYLNGTFLGSLDGFMDRGNYNISELVRRNGQNILAVLVHIPKTPLANQGSPNYLSSGGWDWMPYVPGLNSGLTDKVFLSNTGKVTLVDPWIRTQLPTRSRAELSIETELKNNSAQKTQVKLQGTIEPGNIVFSETFELNPYETRKVKFDKRYFPQLVINAPKLWWPNGYGDPNLYTCRFETIDNNTVSDSQTVRFGIRKYTYDKKDGVFHLFINDTPVFVKGGNWGMSEYMLRCRGEEYETKIRLHKEQNFNMIRNWLGSTTDEEFYDYCDQYGIMIWDDFWINSNPNLPYDLNVFNHNMIEKIKRFRNHPSIAVWCGDNEGVPEAPLAGWMAENIKTFDAGDRYFQACSNADGLSGSGPWGAFDPRWYFTKYPDCSSGGDVKRGWGFRTEIGTAVVPAFESFKKFMPEKDWWPINEMWNTHYFGQNAFNATPERYTEQINQKFGPCNNAEEFCRKAQLINLESNKALFEGWLDHIGEDASGIMTWMSQSAYPSMVWQTYDYYYDLTGAYWGCKSACEPLHIFWNPVTDAIKVGNTTGKDYYGLKAEVTVYNSDGKPVKAYTKEATVDALSHTATQCMTIDFNKDRKILSLNKPAVASSTTHGHPDMVADGKDDTRWAGEKADNEWIYVDLGEKQDIGGVRLNWEAAYGKSYKIQVSDDAKKWREVYNTDDGKPGIEEITFPEVKARYVRMFGIKLGWWFGYSLWSMDVLSGTQPSEGLSDVHFIRLKLKDRDGKLLSENNYWRGNNRTDFTAVNQLPNVNLKVKSKLTKKNGKATITAQVSLPSKSPAVAFAVQVQAVRESDGERLLPAIMNDNYFTLIPGESKTVTIEFDEKLLDNGNYKLIVKPYNGNI